MKDTTRKDDQNENQTPVPEYHSADGDFISELVTKYVRQMRSTNTPILSYESSDSPAWIKLLFERIEI